MELLFTVIYFITFTWTLKQDRVILILFHSIRCNNNMKIHISNYWISWGSLEGLSFLFSHPELFQDFQYHHQPVIFLFILFWTMHMLKFWSIIFGYYFIIHSAVLSIMKLDLSWQWPVLSSKKFGDTFEDTGHVRDMSLKSKRTFEEKCLRPKIHLRTYVLSFHT